MIVYVKINCTLQHKIGNKRTSPRKDNSTRFAYRKICWRVILF